MSVSSSTGPTYITASAAAAAAAGGGLSPPSLEGYNCTGPEGNVPGTQKTQQAHFNPNEIAEIAKKVLETLDKPPADWSNESFPQEMAVRFYKKGAQNGSEDAQPEFSFLGNFHRCDIVIPSSQNSLKIQVLCSESLYQMAKFLDPNQPISDAYNQNVIDRFSTDFQQGLIKERESTCTQEEEKEDLAGQITWELAQPSSLINSNFKVRSDWNDQKLPLMRNILILKFSQNRDCLEALLQTGNKVLIERTNRDSYWGDGIDRKSNNHLGRSLMYIRNTFQSTRSLPPLTDKNGDLISQADTIRTIFPPAPTSATSPPAATSAPLWNPCVIQ